MRVASQMLKASGFTGVNTFNQYASASIAEIWLDDLSKTAMGVTKSAFGDAAKNRAVNELTRLGIDPTKKLTSRDMSRGMYRVARDTQLQRNVLADPVIFNDPKYRPFVLFKRFGVRQATWVKDQILRDLAQNGNPLPLIRLAVGGIAGGEGVIWAKDKVREYLGGQPAEERDMPMLTRIAENIGAVGALGVADLIMDAENRNWKFMRALTPVQASTVDQIRETAMQVINEWDQYDSQDVLQRAIKPASKIGGGMVRALAQQVETPSQRKGIVGAQREMARRKALDAIIGGDKEAAAAIYQQWSSAHPDTPLFNPDENVFDLVYERHFNAAKKRANP
jgi:hypothetical protein